jgi:hypothetical protein
LETISSRLPLGWLVPRCRSSLSWSRRAIVHSAIVLR